MFDITTTLGLIQWALLALLVGYASAWLFSNNLSERLSLVELAGNEIRNLINTRKVVLWLIISFSLAALLLQQHMANPIQPPSTIMAQQEYRRTQKPRPSRGSSWLDSFNFLNMSTPTTGGWFAKNLKLADGWHETQLEVKPKDYLWVFSLDSCYIEVRSQNPLYDSVRVIALAAQGKEFQIHKEAAISLKVPIKEPPLYNDSSKNVFIKHWSQSWAVTLRGFIVFPAFILLAFAAMVATFYYEKRPKDSQKKRRGVQVDMRTKEDSEMSESDIKDFEKRDSASSSTVSFTDRYDLSSEAIGKATLLQMQQGKISVTRVVERVGKEIERSYKKGGTVNLAGTWVILFKNYNFRRRLESKVKNQVALRAFIEELNKYLDAHRDLMLTDLKDKEAVTEKQANIAENEARIVEARNRQKGVESDPSSPKKEERIFEQKQPLSPLEQTEQQLNEMRAAQKLLDDEIKEKRQQMFLKKETLKGLQDSADYSGRSGLIEQTQSEIQTLRLDIQALEQKRRGLSG